MNETIKQMHHDIGVLNAKIAIMNVEIRDLRSNLKSEQLLQGMVDISQEIESDGWITHTGNECPVNPETEGIVRFRTGNETESGQFGTLCWKHRMESWDIIAYKITNPYIEPMLKLIDWGMEGMEGCMTNYGTLFQSETKENFVNCSNDNGICLGNSDLRLATPKDHEGWQSALNFEDIDSVIKKLRTQCEVKIICYWGGFENRWITHAFRITGLAEGITDDPSKAGV